jgi:hypothetical protein
MNLGRWYCFVPWFACKDLFGRWRSLRITLVNLGSVLALVAFALLVYGLVLGTGQRQKERYRLDPLATCLVLKPVAGGKRIAPAEVAGLEKAVRARLVAPDRPRVAAFYTLTLEWFRPGTEVSPPFQGRTVAANDPLFDSYQEARHWQSGGPADSGRAATLGPALLKELGLSPQALPGRLDVRTPLSKQPVPVTGALAHDLPERYDFLLPEPLYLELRRKGHNPREAEVYTGPLTPRWAALEELPPEVDRFLLDKGIAWGGVPEDRGDGVKVWRFSSNAADPPCLEEWQVRLESIARRLEKEHGKAAPSFTEPAPVRESPPPPPPKGYQRLALYLDDPNNLEPAVEAAAALGYEPVDDRHEQFLRINRTTARALALFGWVLAAVALLVAWNVYAIQRLQAEQKRAEVGMLGALGMTRARLLAIYLLEAVLLWLPGAALGVAAGWGLGHAAEWWMARDAPQATLAFTVPRGYLACIVAGSLGLCLFSTLLAAWRCSLRHSPLECLSEA